MCEYIFKLRCMCVGEFMLKYPSVWEECTYVWKARVWVMWVCAHALPQSQPHRWGHLEAIRGIIYSRGELTTQKCRLLEQIPRPSELRDLRMPFSWKTTDPSTYDWPVPGIPQFRSKRSVPYTTTDPRDLTMTCSWNITDPKQAPSDLRVASAWHTGGKRPNDTGILIQEPIEWIPQVARAIALSGVKVHIIVTLTAESTDYLKVQSKLPQQLKVPPQGFNSK